MTEEVWNCICGGLGKKFCTKCGRSREEAQEELAKVRAAEAKNQLQETTPVNKAADKSVEMPLAITMSSVEKVGDKLKSEFDKVSGQIKNQDIGNKIANGLENAKTEVNAVQEKFVSSFGSNNDGIKKYLPIVVIAVLVACVGGWYFMGNKSGDKPTANNFNNAKIETSTKKDSKANKILPEEATLSENENGIKTFATRLEAKNKETKKKANGLVWITTKVYKRGNDIIVEGAYYNGGQATIGHETDMKMEIALYGKGKEVGHFKDVTFNQAPTKGLTAGKQKKVHYEIKGKANEVGEFSTFEVKASVKKSH